MNDCLDSLRHRICNVLTSHVPFDKDTGELYPDTRFVSPERLADELIKLLDDENVSRILELYYKSRCGDGEL
ncbi:MAG: hypothetical protein IJ104_00905 [Methanobrevibacter sp.]|nr:hypothetical protein [Methanobrevibacter sp.]MBQ9024929.1 hypothetical protein [Methanobrevibacter sp.]